MTSLSFCVHVALTDAATEHRWSYRIPAGSADDAWEQYAPRISGCDPIVTRLARADSGLVTVSDWSFRLSDRGGDMLALIGAGNPLRGAVVSLYLVRDGVFTVASDLKFRGRVAFDGVGWNDSRKELEVRCRHGIAHALDRRIPTERFDSASPVSAAAQGKLKPMHYGSKPEGGRWKVSECHDVDDAEYTYLNTNDFLGHPTLWATTLNPQTSDPTVGDPPVAPDDALHGICRLTHSSVFDRENLPWTRLSPTITRTIAANQVVNIDEQRGRFRIDYAAMNGVIDPDGGPAITLAQGRDELQKFENIVNVAGSDERTARIADPVFQDQLGRSRATYIDTENDRLHHKYAGFGMLPPDWDPSHRGGLVDAATGRGAQWAGPAGFHLLVGHGGVPNGNVFLDDYSFFEPVTSTIAGGTGVVGVADVPIETTLTRTATIGQHLGKLLFECQGVLTPRAGLMTLEADAEPNTTPTSTLVLSPRNVARMRVHAERWAPYYNRFRFRTFGHPEDPDGYLVASNVAEDATAIAQYGLSELSWDGQWRDGAETGFVDAKLAIFNREEILMSGSVHPKMEASDHDAFMALECNDVVPMFWSSEEEGTIAMQGLVQTWIPEATPLAVVVVGLSQDPMTWTGSFTVLGEPP